MKDQLKLFINNNYLDINSPEYMQSIYDLVVDIKENISKRMLVLCTSYKQIIGFKKFLSNIDNIYFQDKTTSKEILIKNYLSNNNSVLFGTSSFWEGVDLPNDKLEILIIMKVPFSNPYNPIVQFLYNVTEPVLYRIRRAIPMSGMGIDFSPIAVLLAIIFLQTFLVNTLSRLAMQLQ